MVHNYVNEGVPCGFRIPRGLVLEMCDPCFHVWGGLFNAIADLYICDGFARLLRRRKVKLAMWLRELLKAIVRT